MALKPVTVTQLNEYISRVLGTDPLLSNISVTGEISNLKFHSSGHLPFPLFFLPNVPSCNNRIWILPLFHKASLQTIYYSLYELSHG